MSLAHTIQGRKWTITTSRNYLPIKRSISIGFHIDIHHPMVILFLPGVSIHIGKHYKVDGQLVIYDPALVDVVFG